MNNENNLSSIEIDPEITPQRSIIWMHGLGADGNDFVPIASELKLPVDLGVRFVFPHAPVMPVTINNGFEMRAWFDVFSLSLNMQVDEQGIRKSIHAIEKLIANEIARGIPTQNIILAGFSQGAVIALMLGLSFAKPLAGIIALSGFLPFEKIKDDTSDANRHIPIFIAHGTDDPMVPYVLGEATFIGLKQAGYPVTWHDYSMPHSVCNEEIRDLRKWLQMIWKF